MSQANNPPTGAPVRDLKAIQDAGKQIAKDAGGTLVRDFFAANKSAIAAVLPKHITPEWMTGVALRALFDGAHGAYRDAVLLNAAAALLVAGRVATLPEGVAAARDSLDSGAARARAAALARISPLA